MFIVLTFKGQLLFKILTCTRKPETQHKIQLFIEFSIYLQIFPEDSLGLDFEFVVVGT